MVSLEEERLVQMVHDFIESESSTPPIFPASSNCLSINQARCFTLQEILGRVTEAETKVLETLLKHMRSKNDAEKTTSLKMWLLKRLKMDGFNASICRTSWATSLGCPAAPLSLEILDAKLWIFSFSFSFLNFKLWLLGKWCSVQGK